MVLDQPAGLPAGQLAGSLRRHLPDFRWQVGDGPQDGILPLDRPTSIIGRADGVMVLLGIEQLHEALDLPGAPPHTAHIVLTGPSTDDRGLAESLLWLLGDALAGQAGGALQVDEGGHWYGAAELSERVAALGGRPIEDAAFPLSPPPSPPAAPQTFPRGSGTDRPLFGRRKA